ncbi:MAG: glycogen/starch/alpha-glucan phosphorylase [Lentisphaeria bacterium]|nr:glycogen/starch/alpha-glucan phosphorylase [Lentisphaeria bacterium]
MNKNEYAALKEQIKTDYNRHLTLTLAKRPGKASELDQYKALALSIRNLMVEKWLKNQEAFEKKAPRSVYYLSLEYLIGRTLGNAMINLEVYDVAKEAMAELGFEIEELRESEVDAGLGNGGLGRLAACFLDSMATLDLPALGYGIRYDYGIFEQKINHGYQCEIPDNWLRNGNPWEFARPDRARTIKFYGRTICEHGSECSNSTKKQWVDTEDVLAMPYDTPIPGFRTKNVNTLRLWSAQSLHGFDLNKFNAGDYKNANINKSLTENITKVLYPNDNNYEGKELRLKQQYFLVSSTLQDIMSRHKMRGGSAETFNEKASIQLNDTHPALAVPELLRLLIDEEGLNWDQAWAICTKTFAYTNHTLMSEALETWSISLLTNLLPRIMEIIYEINLNFLRLVANKYPGDTGKIQRMSLIQESDDKKVRMAYMAIVASHHVNGVAALHTQLLKDGLFNDFYQLWPEKFINMTNGITPRRWLKKSNPALSDLISTKISDKWAKDLMEIKALEKFADDKKFRKEFRAVKRQNKEEMARYIKEKMNIDINVDSMFDIQIKRLHEYKRQLLNIMHVISLYMEMKENPTKVFAPRTVMFGAKAAPGYHMAKLIIKLINSVADVVNNDKTIGDKLKVVFLENYRVSLAEKIIPAADLSEQISLAGTEASGTGNMKLSLNGALTIGTMDGANVEIFENVGADNIFIFGMSVEEVHELKGKGYNPHHFIQKSPKLQQVIHLIESGFFSQDDHNRFRPIIETIYHDEYMVCADFDAYCECQNAVGELFLDQDEWSRKAILNVANMGHFSSDRTIAQYAKEIWDITPIVID